MSEEAEDTPLVIKPTDGKLGEEIRELLLGLIGGAESDLRQFDQDRKTSIHQLRKKGKKMRGMLRLIRTGLSEGDYDAADALARGFAKWFSEVRDAAVLVETCDLVSEENPDADFSGIRSELEDRYSRIDEGEATRRAAEESERQLGMLRNAVGAINLDGVSSDTLVEGFEAVYQRGKSEFIQARESRSAEDCHSWRKRAKYLSFHCELLEKPKAERFSDLGSLLGSHHDLAVFREEVEDAGTTIPVAADIPKMQADLEQEAFELGAELFAV